ncbi:MAG: bifunctional phosphoribosylaminoimidazolecarboxamide formyltransferase/IMP cyclohydrolase [Clostridiales bacterium]|jgi:phosphoribosylaminoimidazolecarboxamide formyltransferase/IMP cyclohydrolase|nr:bifunctional phosphoribosylaminoimidazolecarboxamide formyltransferase/IMP cyclohydrolase [Clostridiales bacterium]
MKRALISLSDKTGIEDFAKGLIESGYEIISTGGTYERLKNDGIEVVAVDRVTGFEECLDGRVKTLHPAIHGGILAVRDNESHMAHMADLGYGTIDMVVVNLYPFKQTLLTAGAQPEEIIENIDIGGPAMVRSAAKNHKFVAVVVDPEDYGEIRKELTENKEISMETKVRLAAKAFAHTAAYDALIASYMKGLSGMDDFTETITLTYEKAKDLRYGENPHQKAAYYKALVPLKGGLQEATQLHGKELSFNNINDLNGAVALIKEFDRPTAVCVKHSAPCGVGEADTLHDAFIKAYEADPLSIFGGIVALNREVDYETAKKLSGIFLEIIIAPAYTEQAMEILTKKKNVRVMVFPNIALKPGVKTLDIKKVLGGLLIQETDDIVLDNNNIKCVTKKQPTPEEMKDLFFAFKVSKHTKSNAIVLGKNGQSIGIGGGQVNRIWALKHAIEHGNEFLGAHSTKGACLASDAFFPFADCVTEAHKAGITAIIQPGGSVRDSDSIEKCDEYGIAMVFTGVRHFKH